MMNFKIKSTAGTENFTATADSFVERNWNKSALLLTFVATDKSKCRPHRAVGFYGSRISWVKKYKVWLERVEPKSHTTEKIKQENLCKGIDIYTIILYNNRAV